HLNTFHEVTYQPPTLKPTRSSHIPDTADQEEYLDTDGKEEYLNSDSEGYH
ncbi:11646_t:CDS:1, partial [Funneliformis geosporum]